MKRVQFMTPEGLEELVLVDGALVWATPEEMCIRFPLPSSMEKEKPPSLLHLLFSTTLSIVPARSAKLIEKESEESDGI